MTSSHISNINNKLYKAAVTLLLMISLAAAAGTYFVNAASLNETVDVTQSAVSELDVSIPDETLLNRSNESVWFSPAEALVRRKPILLLFIPYEACQIRYCWQPSMVASRLAVEVGDEISFVPVIVYAMPEQGYASPIQYTLDNWDIYPIPPYDSWLPEAVEIPEGSGLDQEVFTLVDPDGNLISQGYEFPDLSSIAGPQNYQ